MTIPTEIDPRIERTRRVVLEAAAELIGECGFGRTSIEAVSDRSGVARSTIYRHWKSRNDLLLESIGTKVEQVQAGFTGDLKADLAKTFGHISQMLSHENTRNIFASFLAETTRDDEMREILERITTTRRAVTEQIITRAKAEGGLPPHVEVSELANDLAGGVFFRGLVMQHAVSMEWLESHIERVVALHSATQVS